MGDDRKVRHHTVPKGYLKYFSDAKEQVKVTNFTRATSYNSGIVNASVRNGFYFVESIKGKDEDIIETRMLCELIENPAWPVFNNILTQNWPLPETERDTFAHYVTMQYLRVPDNLEPDKYSLNTIYDLTERLRKGQISENHFYEVSRQAYTGELAVDARHHLHYMLFLENFNFYFYGRIWVLVTFPEEYPLITSDSPVIVLPKIANPIEIRGKQYSQESSGRLESPMLLFPINRHQGLIMLLGGELPVDVDDFATGNYDFRMVGTPQLQALFNDSILTNCHQEVYCHPKDQFLVESSAKFLSSFSRR